MIVIESVLDELSDAVFWLDDRPCWRSEGRKKGTRFMEAMDDMSRGSDKRGMTPTLKWVK